MHGIEIFCADCGALNQQQGVTCFACGALLPADAAANYIDPDQFIPGNLFKGRYRILSQVGSGGFGAVYKARDIRENDRLVAIKAIHLRGLKPREVIEATDTFNREVMMLSSLDHVHLPHVYDHFTDTEHWYLVMEFIEGETLEAYLSRAAVRNSTSLRGAPLQDVLNIGIQLCTVLDYLHTRHPPIVFRDIKPSNVLRMPDGHIYLIDFGIARHFKPGQARDTIVLGSPGYAAPEQYGKAQTTPRSDIYSLGALLHHLLTGSDPMDNPFHFAPLRASDASLSLELDALIEQMLSLDASKRPASIRVVKETLQQIARRVQVKQRLAVYASYGANAAVHVASPPVPPASPSRRRFVPARRMVQRAALAAFTMLMIVGLCSFMFNMSHPPIIDPGPHQISPADVQVYHMPVISTTGDIATLDPALASDAQSLKVAAMLYTGLVGLNTQLQVVPELATSWSVSSDGLHWTFYLRPGLKFSDGTPLTSADVAYSLNRALAPVTKSAGSLTYLGLIKDAGSLHAGRISTLIGDSITTPDPATLSITLTSPGQYFLTALAYPCSYVVERSLITKYGERFTDHLEEGGGDAPFKVQRYAHRSGLTLVKNPDYYGPLAKLFQIVISFYTDVETVYQDYLAGRLDETPVPQANGSRDQGRDDLHQAPQLTTYYYAMNYLVKPFDNIHIRQALAMALERNTLAGIVWKGRVLPIDTLIPRGLEAYYQMPSGFAGILNSDPIRAKILLQQGMSEEGYNNLEQLPAITFTYHSTSPASDKEVTVDLQMWQSVLGVRVHADPVKDGDRFAREVSHSAHNSHGLQMWADSFTVDYPDLQDVLTRQFDKNSPYNTVNYGQNTSSDAGQQQDIQRQLEAADLNPDATTRLQAYQQAEQQVLNDVAWLPMFQATGDVLVQSHIQGMLLGAVPFIFPDDWGNIYIDPPQG